VTLTLVAGSYPPIPRPATGATVDAVKREWEQGHEVVVVSPRPSAAHFAVPLAGPLAGRRLDNVRRHSGATRLVFCAEPGLPFERAASGMAARWIQRWGATQLAQAMGRFDHAVLVVTDPDLPIAALRTGADEVVHDLRPGPAPAGVTVLGPGDVLWRDRAARRGGQLARAVLGEQWGPVRNGVAGALRQVRGVARR
jgi:hypothetical protein